MKIKSFLAVLLCLGAWLTTSSQAQALNGTYNVTENWKVTIVYNDFGTTHKTGTTVATGSNTGTVVVNAGKYTVQDKVGFVWNSSVRESLTTRTLVKSGDTFSITSPNVVFIEAIKPIFAIPPVFSGIAFAGFFAVPVVVDQGEFIAASSDYQYFTASGPADNIRGTGHFNADGANIKVESTTKLTVKPPETVLPTVKITTPLNNVHVTTPSVTVTGTATDNVGIDRVEYRVENASGTNEYQTATVVSAAWTTTVALPPGKNTIRVRSKDVSGNYSSAATVVVFYDKTAPLQVTVVGPGSVTKTPPTLNLNTLVLGTEYKLVAKPNAGCTFKGWTVGGVATTGANLTFRMVEGLTIVAVFQDTTAPEVTVKLPKNNERVLNNHIAVSGTAKDNAILGPVFVQVGGGTPVEATGRSNWTANIHLADGPNTIRVYAEDVQASPLRSKTNTLTVTYVVSAPFVATTNGPGKIAPSLNGQLEVGKVYTITATANAGARFVGWSGSTNTTSSKLVFAMRAGFAVTATFADNTAPVVKIASPMPNEKVLTNNIVVRGTATDNAVLGPVFVQVGTAEPVQATGRSNWTANIHLADGPNTISVFATDVQDAPLRSKTNTITVTYVVSVPFVASTNGPGKIAPALNGQLEVGKVYTITATANAGARFVSWSGSTNTTSSKLVFAMRAGFAVTATFTDNSAPVVKIDSPKPNDKVLTNNIVARGTATDNGVIDKVFFIIDNQTAAEAVGASNWTIPLDDLALGGHVLQVYAKDTAGNFSKTNAVIFTIPSYEGIYMGTYASKQGAPENGLTAVLVRRDQTAVLLYGTSKLEDGVAALYEVAIERDGSFSTVLHGEELKGKVTATGITGTYSGMDDDGSVYGGAFTLTRKPDTGPQVANAGFYEGAYSFPGEIGDVTGILAANGDITFVVAARNLPGEPAAGAGKGTVNAQNKFAASINAPPAVPINGNLNPDTKVITGTFQAESGTGTVTISRVFTTADSQPPGLAGLQVTSLDNINYSAAIFSEVGSVSEEYTMRVAEPPIPVTPAPVSQLTVTSLDDAITFSFTTEAGRSYTVEVSEDFTSWHTLTSFTADAAESSYSDPVATTGGARFYRVLAQ